MSLYNPNKSKEFNNFQIFITIIEWLQKNVPKNENNLNEEYSNNNGEKINLGYSLSSYGWYISLIMDNEILIEIIKHLKNNNKNEIDILFLKYFTENFETHIELLKEYFPKRRNILNEAFKCHIKKQYFASTIIFLSQCDGIFNGNTFNKKKLKKYLINSDKNNLVRKILLIESAIDVPFQKKNKHNSDLNRHEVMHGISTTYGTEINSIKALSMLCFIAEIL